MVCVKMCAGLALATTSLLARCSASVSTSPSPSPTPTSVDAQELQKAAAAALMKETGATSPPDIRCTAGLNVAPGSTQTCILVVDGKNYDVTMTSKNIPGDFHVQVAPTPNAQ